MYLVTMELVAKNVHLVALHATLITSLSVFHVDLDYSLLMENALLALQLIVLSAVVALVLAASKVTL